MMGMCFLEYQFAGSAPDAAAIEATASQIAGLRVSVGLREHCLEPDSLYGEISFDCTPSNCVEIAVYDRRLGRDPYHQQVADKTGIRTVRLSMLNGQEPTILAAVCLALESLGGSTRHAIPHSARRLVSGTLTVGILRRRARMRAALAWLTIPYVLVMLPVWVGWALIATLFEIRSFRKRVSDPFGDASGDRDGPKK
ncbi:hypothetical protein [Tahibacter amnicola]|uniref:Uncharacterized protein n=1 Tax=Tahibacter amnicola TaxID=2976241 RepID=A0ABY6BCC3_9GAMM|nr:hypothetical protein [Tahibacter amnicola]UXI66770.1 hypothetical protein N4264_18725 [Tahibacter amnicola]